MQLARPDPHGATHAAHAALQFQVFGVVVDKNMLFRIGSTLVGLLSTGLPIMFGLRQDMNEEFTHNTTDTTEGQLQLIREQMAKQAQKLAAHTQQLAALPALVQQELLALLVNRTFMLSCEVHAYRA